MPRKTQYLLISLHVIATVQLVWCYLWLTTAYIDTFRYERGLERMPFQSRVWMMWVMQFAHNSVLLGWLAKQLERLPFWFTSPYTPKYWFKHW